MFRLLKYLIIIAIIGYGAFYGYMRFFGHGGAGPHGMMGQGGAAPVSVAEVVSKDVQQWQEFSGRIVAIESAEIRPQVSGILEKVHFKEGDRVKKGALLFTIDQRPYRAALDSAQARFTLADSELRRAEILLAENAISQSEFDKRNNAAEVAKADLTRAKLDYGYTTIKSPINGRVGRPEITVGNLVSDGGSAPVLTTVVSDQAVYADFDIDELAYLQYMKSIGDRKDQIGSIPVYLGLADEKDATHAGLVQSFDNKINTMTSTIRVRAIFDNEDGTLVPGLFARVRMGGIGTTREILVTDRAIGTDQNKKFVLMVGAESKVEYRPVVLGGMADGMRIVKSGLNIGDKIIVNGLQRAMPGSPVTPEVVPMDAPESQAQPQAPAAEAETKEAH